MTALKRVIAARLTKIEERSRPVTAAPPYALPRCVPTQERTFLRCIDVRVVIKYRSFICSLGYIIGISSDLFQAFVLRCDASPEDDKFPLIAFWSEKLFGKIASTIEYYDTYNIFIIVFINVFVTFCLSILHCKFKKKINPITSFSKKKTLFRIKYKSW